MDANEEAPHNYQVGRAGDPQSNDPWFETLTEAINYCVLPSDSVPFAVWDKDGEILWLVFECDVFKKA